VTIASATNERRRGRLVVSPLASNPSKWKLERPFVYRGRTDHFEIPAGFVTDFASVPRILWSILPPYGEHTEAAVVHDWLYSVRPLVATGRFVGGSLEHRRISRADADGIFRRIMRERGVGFVRRWVMYLGVRLGGWRSWREHRARERDA
jgi:hypothetical protein